MRITPRDLPRQNLVSGLYRSYNSKGYAIEGDAKRFCWKCETPLTRYNVRRGFSTFCRQCLPK